MPSPGQPIEVWAASGLRQQMSFIGCLQSSRGWNFHFPSHFNTGSPAEETAACLRPGLSFPGHWLVSYTRVVVAFDARRASALSTAIVLTISLSGSSGHRIPFPAWHSLAQHYFNTSARLPLRSFPAITVFLHHIIRCSPLRSRPTESIRRLLFLPVISSWFEENTTGHRSPFALPARHAGSAAPPPMPAAATR